MLPTPPVILNIAGFDPSSGAGVTADIKAIAAHGFYGVACITALTVQSTAAVRRVQAVDAEVVRETLEELAADFDITSIHIGMLCNAAICSAVADFLAQGKFAHVVLDPILKSSSGASLLDAEGAEILVDRLFPLATVVTPNVDEASTLTGMPVSSLPEMRTAAAKLHAMGAKAVVVTGGHLNPAIDLLSAEGGTAEEVFKSGQQQSRSTHGTGCAFACAIACNLAEGRPLAEAVLLAKSYVAAAIAKAYPLGKGIGPINHLYRMAEPRRAKAAGDPEH